MVRLGFPGCDVSLVDPAAAEQSFLLAARYARADAPGDAARALFSAGWAAFVQGKLRDALQHTEGAIAVDAKFAEALFQAAKVRMAQGDPDAALPALRRAIDLDRGYALRAAGDDVFRQDSRSIDAFLEALRIENARTLQPVARARLVELAPLIAKSSELAGHGTVRRLTKVAEAASVVGLMDLLGFEKDAEELSAFICLLAGRLRREVIDVSVDRDVEEAYDVPETYQENVVIRAASLFRKERTQLVKNVRTVRKTRTVRQPFRERRNLWMNGLRDVVSAIEDEWILVRPGTFHMGGHMGDHEGLQTPHDVTITRPFLMQATPVTQAQWEAIMGSNPSPSWDQNQNADHPVAYVSWFDAIAYCKALSRTEELEEAYATEGAGSVRWKGLDALGYRLPTEAEWEYACRAGTTGERYGDVDAVAWWEGNSGIGNSGKIMHPVGQKLPNPWGFFDMLGNVCEWCWNWYGVYPEGAVTDPVGPEVSGGVTDLRVNRGGHFHSSAKQTRAGERHLYMPDAGTMFCGFRPVRTYPIPPLHRQIERQI